MKQEELGVVTIGYHKNGKQKYAMFNPTMQVKANPQLLKQLHGLKAENEVEKIALSAEHMFSEWFVKTNNIELADRNQYRIDKEIISCDKYPTGEIKECIIKIIFVPINTQ